MDKKRIVEDVLKLGSFIDNHNDMIFGRIMYAGKTVMETMKIDGKQMEQQKKKEYQVLFFSGCLPFINSVIQVGSNPKQIRAAINAIEKKYASSNIFVDSVAVLSKNTLFIILEYCINRNEKEFEDYESKDETSKELWWAQLRTAEQQDVEGGEIEPNMLTLGHSDKESYWNERKNIWKLIKDYILPEAV